MKVDTITLIGNMDTDFRGIFTVVVDGVKVASFREGEPEDATLSGDFNDVYAISSLIEQAYGQGESDEANGRETRLTTVHHEVSNRKEYEDVLDSVTC